MYFIILYCKITFSEASVRGILCALGEGCASPQWLYVCFWQCSYRHHCDVLYRVSAYCTTTSVMAYIFPTRKQKVFFLRQGETDFPDLCLCCLATVFFLFKFCLKMQSLENLNCGSLKSTLCHRCPRYLRLHASAEAQHPDNWSWLVSPRKLQVSVLFSFLVSEYFNFFSCRFSYSFRLKLALFYPAEMSKYLWSRSFKFSSQPK